MANFIRIGNKLINLDQVIDVHVVPGTLVTICTTELVGGGDEDGAFSVSRTFGFAGPEAEALTAFFTSMAPDVLAMHGKEATPAATGAMCANCHEEPVVEPGVWCRGCLDWAWQEERAAAGLTDFEARR